MSENTIHYSDCQLHDGPANISRVCSCGADPLADPISYGSEFPSKQAEEGYRAGFIDGRCQLASNLAVATSALETAIGLLEGFAKDVPACEYLDHSVGGKPTALDDLRAALQLALAATARASSEASPMSTEPTSHLDLPVSSEGVGHTPGPWAYEFRKGECSDGCVTRESNLVAIVAGGNYGEWRDSADGGETEFEANTRLIAAAPDLLDALQRIVSPAPGVSQKAPAWVYGIARAAISQATRSESST